MRAVLHVAVALLISAGMQSGWAQSPPAATGAVQNTLAQRMQACSVCHGQEGRATNQGYFPRIAGKPAGYLYNQLQNFKSGLRKYGPMNHLVQHMSDDYMREIATYFSVLDLPNPPMQVTRLTPAGQRTAENLVLRGAPERGIPACVACHGPQMAGMLPAMPGLLTLPADYLAAQLGAWKAGQRKAKDPDCMADIARRLEPDEVSVLAQWLSTQTLPGATKPAPPSGPLPVPCGSAAQ